MRTRKHRGGRRTRRRGGQDESYAIPPLRSAAYYRGSNDITRALANFTFRGYSKDSPKTSSAVAPRPGGPARQGSVTEKMRDDEKKKNELEVALSIAKRFPGESNVEGESGFMSSLLSRFLKRELARRQGDKNDYARIYVTSFAEALEPRSKVIPELRRLANAFPPSRFDIRDAITSILDYSGVDGPKEVLYNIVETLENYTESDPRAVTFILPIGAVKSPEAVSSSEPAGLTVRTVKTAGRKLKKRSRKTRRH